MKSKVQRDCYRGSRQRGVNQSGTNVPVEMVTNVPVEMVTECAGDVQSSPG